MSSSTVSLRRAAGLLGATVVLVAAVAWLVGPDDGPAVAELDRRAEITSSPPRDHGPPPRSPVLWRAEHEDGDLQEWAADDGGGLFNSGTYLASASTSVAHAGSYSLRARIWTPGTSGVRALRWLELRQHRELYFSVWVYLPSGQRVTGTFLNLLQFKSRSTTGRNDPVWGLYGVDDGAGGVRLRPGWGWGGTELPGPFADDGVAGKWLESGPPAILPTDRWVHLEAFLRQSKDHDGRVQFLLDGVTHFDFMNVRTSYDNCSYNDWCASNEWSVNLYSDGMAPAPATMYIDDAMISTSRR